MTLCPLPLDDRTLPTVWYGGEMWLAGHSVTPFEDWHGSLNTYDTGERVYVAPGDGGGPVVAVFDRATGTRTQPDYFAADPSSRAGVAFVAVPGREPVSNPDKLTAGPADGFPVYVDFETARPTDWQRQVFDGIADQLTPLGVRLTTTRPDALPNTYGTILVGPWTFTGSGGVFPGPAWDTPISDYTPRAVWVGDYPDPAITTVVGVHEFGHALDLPHVDDPTDVMDATAHPGARLSAVEVATLTDRITPLRGR